MSLLFSVLSDLLINLAAGWIGAAFVIPITIQKYGKKRFYRFLTLNISFAIVSLLLAYLLREASL